LGQRNKGAQSKYGERQQQASSFSEAGKMIIIFRLCSANEDKCNVNANGDDGINKQSTE